jgi:4-carboxymuconolactone decarboxylase
VTISSKKPRQPVRFISAGSKEKNLFELWRSFDKELGKDLSLFITGKLYAREKVTHPTRQLVTVAVLTVLSRPEELKLHIQAALNVGCAPQEIAEVIFQTFTYGGIPTVNTAFKGAQRCIDREGPMAHPGIMNWKISQTLKPMRE